MRNTQIPLAASAIRQLLPPRRSHHPLTNFGDRHTQYWGNHAEWDVLYLGHCGDYFEEVTEDGIRFENEYNMSAIPHITYNDSTVPAPSDLHPFTQILFDKLDVPAHSRILHRSRLPLCTFGYALTRSAAERLVDDLAPIKLKADGPRAFDVALLEACRKGANTPSPTLPEGNLAPHPNPELRGKYASAGLRCWTLNSELFHHMPGHSLIDTIGLMSGEQPGIPPVDLAAQQQVAQRRETTNIECGFWSGDFAFAEGDTEKLEYLREHVGRKGECLKERLVDPSSTDSRMQEYEPEERSEDDDADDFYSEEASQDI